MGQVEHEGAREARLVAVDESLQVPLAVSDLEKMTMRLEAALDELTTRLAPVLSESTSPGDVATERLRMDVPLAQSIAEQTGRLAHLERRMGNLLQRLGV